MFDPLSKADPDWFVFLWMNALVSERVPGELVPIGAIRRPPDHVGFLLECTTGGLVPAYERPAWPREAGVVVRDGSVEWTTRRVDEVVGEILSIVSCSYSVTPGGIEVVDEVIEGGLMRTLVRLDAAAASEGEYSIRALMVDSEGEEHSLVETVMVTS